MTATRSAFPISRFPGHRTPSPMPCDLGRRPWLVADITERPPPQLRACSLERSARSYNDSTPQWMRRVASRLNWSADSRPIVAAADRAFRLGLQVCAAPRADRTRLGGLWQPVDN